MRKYIYIALFFLLCAGRASAQFTLVSGTVTDVNGLAYACGTISASIVNLNGQSLYLNGAQFSAQPAAAKLGCPTDPTTSRTSGAFTLQLADNTQIKCGSGPNIITCGTQTQWLFTVNTLGSPPPVGTGPQFCTATLTISGASQSISASFATCPALSSVTGTSFPLLAPNGTSGAPSYSFSSATGNGMYIQGSGVGFAVGGALIYTISAGGMNLATGLAFQSSQYLTNANCASSASPAACGAANAGSVTIAAAATTIQVNTTIVTANSQILITEDSSLGTRLGVTCNTTTGRTYTITTRTAGTSFVVTASAAPAANPACLSYFIVN